MIKKFKNEFENLNILLLNLTAKKRFLYGLISLLLSLFFVSAPIAICANLFLFVQYIVYVNVAFTLVIFVFFMLFRLIHLSILKRALNEKFRSKHIIIYYLFESLILSIILLVILFFITKEYIW